ncbi:MAG: hypothetical protein EHM28_00845 [Spirochaetaceae bacterium]|nr:MAG: hypothetical protein EHM28_00845 [Spirochaetaceae bacterium]
MTKFVLISAMILFVMMTPMAFCQEPEAINQIRQYYEDTQKQINDGRLYQRTLAIEYPVVPAIGTPVSRVVIYYDMISTRPGDYDLAVIKIVHYYQHAGRVFYEECLYSQKGEPVFCFNRSGTGDISDPDSVEWDGEARYYFVQGNVARIVADARTTDNPRGDLLGNGRSCLAHTKELLDSIARLGVPQPFIFLNPVL